MGTKHDRASVRCDDAWKIRRGFGSHVPIEQRTVCRRNFDGLGFN